MNDTLGECFARAVATKDFEAAAALLDPNVDFRAMTPGRVWEAADPETVRREILPEWYAERDRIDGVLGIENDRVGDRLRVGYRYAVSNPDGPFVIEQQAYYEVHNGTITWMRVLCSGWRPRDATPKHG